jgi:2-oxoisovalerate dehydrogenase E2 component (dihydrolipoyl transacylase)
VHLGIATATERGLVVAHRPGGRPPVDARAGRRDGPLRRGRPGRDTPGCRIVGSTFTVSNLGALGLDEGTPVINYPEAAILGVRSIKERPVVVADKVVARSTAALTLAFDHRVCDGAEAALLWRLRALVECPELAPLNS